MYGDEHELMDLRLFATDGSFSANRDSMKDIIAPEADLRDRGKGSGGIVFIPVGTRMQNHRGCTSEVTTLSLE
jgi:hypothetical protein